MSQEKLGESEDADPPEKADANTPVNRRPQRTRNVPKHLSGYVCD